MTVPVQRVTLVTLGVADLDRARQFYARLGWVAATRRVNHRIYDAVVTPW